MAVISKRDWYLGPGGPAEEPQGTSNFSAAFISSAVQADGGFIDEAEMQNTIIRLPAFVRQNASMMIGIGAAQKPGTLYAFDNRATSGVIIQIGFTRASQSGVMNRDNAYWLYQINEPAFEYESTYQTEKQAVINSILNSADVVYVEDFLPSGYVTNGSVNYGSQFNQALDAGLNVVMPNFPIRCNDGSYTANNGQRILFQANSEIWTQPGHSSVDYNVLMLRGKRDIVLVDAKIRGDWGHGHLSPLSYERGQGITISGCQNVTMYDPYVYDCFGDGIYSAYYSPTGDVENIKIYNPVLVHNGRNNIGITNGINFLLHEGLFLEADKSNPAAGIDFEPNSPTVGNTKRFTDFYVINPITWGNWWSGIQVSMSQRYDTVGDAIQPFNCYIQNHFSSDDVWAHRLTLDMAAGDTTNQHGTLTFLNPELLNPVTYSAPPGGGSATTTTIMQDGDKAVIKYFLDDPDMVIEYLHPKAVLNGNEYDNAELTALFNSINFQRTTKVIVIP